MVILLEPRTSGLRLHIEYIDIALSVYFSSVQTGNFLLSNLKLDKKYYDVLVIITADLDDVDITVNIEQEQFKNI